MRSNKGRKGASSIVSLSLPRRILAAAALLAVAGGQAVAQTPPNQPYAGLQAREIKSLSREQINQLNAGEGMGFALAAELNGYPGPRHVLDLGAQLGLTAAQRADIQRLFDAMKVEALPLGQKLVAAERDLNVAFADRTITQERLAEATAAIGKLQGELRDTHLKFHLATAALLTPDQIHRYGDLRGYAAMASGGMGGAMHHHTMGAMQHGE